MSFLKSLIGSFTGSTAKKAANQGAARQQGYIEQGFGQGINEQRGSFQPSYEALQRGYGGYRSDIQRGGEEGNRYIEQGIGAGRRDLGGGYDQAENAVTDYSGQARNALAGYEAGGARARDAYLGYMGLGAGGAAGAGAAYDALLDPNGSFMKIGAANRDRSQQYLDARTNASGRYGSGGTALASARADREMMDSRANQYLDRLATLGTEGGRYALEGAGIAERTGSRLAELRGQRGRDLSGLEERGRGAQANLIRGVTSDLGSGAERFGGAEAALRTGNANALAGLYTGQGQQQANIEGARGTANINASNTFAQNVLGLGGLAVNAFTGMPIMRGGGANGGYGPSPAQNVGNFVSGAFGGPAQYFGGPAGYPASGTYGPRTNTLPWLQPAQAGWQTSVYPAQAYGQ